MNDFSPQKNETFASAVKLFWMIVAIIYFVISFFTQAWSVTWLIWLIGVALEQAARLLYKIHNDGSEK